MRSLRLSEYFKLTKPAYKYIQITPHKSIRNYNSSNIAKTIAHTYKSLDKRIRREKNKLFFECDFKISYIIDIQNNDAKFYFLVPDPFITVLLEKIKEIWSKATVTILEDKIKSFSEDAEMYQLSYKKEEAMSLQVDKKSNEPLNSILSVMDVMKDDDRITIVYNFLPCSQFGWLQRYNETMDKIKNHKIIDKKQTSPEYIIKSTLVNIIKLFNTFLQVLDDFTGGSGEDSKESLYSSILGVLEQQKELSAATKRKKEQTILDTQIGIISESTDESRKVNNALSVCQAYRVLDEDNELIYKKINNKKAIDLEKTSLGTTISTISTEEASNFIQIPGRSLLYSLGIKFIKVEEVKVPEKLRKGYICLGNAKNKGTILAAYLEDDKEIGSLPLMLLGRQGGGKTTYMCNYANYCLSRNESIVHIDFIKNCEASKSIERVVPKNRLVILDFSTEQGLQALAYNEIRFTDNMSWFEKQALANKKTELTLELINSINVNGDPLSAKMERYLCACTDIVYLNEKATLKDVINCLTNYKYRESILKSIPEELQEELQDSIDTLLELDEWSKASKDNPSEKIGTRDSKIEGILDRVTLLKRDFYLKKMFNKTPEGNIDFAKATEEGKVILVRMPQSKFKDYVKNVITTFLLTKCWLAAELRGELSEKTKRCHVLIDEISQTKTAEMFMESKLTQTRKFGLKFVLTGQYLDQLEQQTIKSLKGAGCSFMLLKGAIKEDFQYFKDELDGTFEYEDLKDMEPFSSLNVIQYSDGYSSFITKLPPELK
ncbi:AAA-like domain protein [Clostridium botulinum 202F]|nr:AAA-like domain protein [Clostridium botulinum 202F]KON14073.1 hypothetical protein ACP50_04290 [Clostridium botulinum]MBY6988506.1 hypothetical protein [Clostridium botulinum]NFH01435.1 hypothetical protein [Clostridium botulinum]NFP40752.1 hypothetical protein [Clostridium botulinum]